MDSNGMDFNGMEFEGVEPSKGITVTGSMDPLNDMLHQGLTDEQLGQLSDGAHTFDDLYEQRAVLFATIVNTYPEHAYKAKEHDDGTMYPGYFLVGVHTPEGDYSYHYELKYWDLFKCQQFARAPKWDGHTDKDVKRLLSLNLWYNVDRV